MCCSNFWQLIVLFVTLFVLSCNIYICVFVFLKSFTLQWKRGIRHQFFGEVNRSKQPSCISALTSWSEHKHYVQTWILQISRPKAFNKDNWTLTYIHFVLVLVFVFESGGGDGARDTWTLTYLLHPCCWSYHSNQLIV